MGLAVQASDNPPRIRVAALIQRGDEIIVVRHHKDQNVYHLLPGGGVEHGETLHKALEREVLEETGLVVQIGRPLILNDTIAPDGSRHLVNITFEAKVVGGSITDRPFDDRIEAVDLVGAQKLQDLDLRPPIADLLLEAIENPASFDTVYAGSLYIVEPGQETET